MILYMHKYFYTCVTYSKAYSTDIIIGTSQRLPLIKRLASVWLWCHYELNYSWLMTSHCYEQLPSNTLLPWQHAHSDGCFSDGFEFSPIGVHICWIYILMVNHIYSFNLSDCILIGSFFFILLAWEFVLKSENHLWVEFGRGGNPP